VLAGSTPPGKIGSLYPVEVTVVGTNALAARPTLIGFALARALTMRYSETSPVHARSAPPANAESDSVTAFPQRAMVTGIASPIAMASSSLVAFAAHVCVAGIAFTSIFTTGDENSTVDCWYFKPPDHMRRGESLSLVRRRRGYLASKATSLELVTRQKESRLERSSEERSSTVGSTDEAHAPFSLCSLG
jgi:hypothetical protein